MNLRELLSSIASEGNERIGHEFLGKFILAWLVVNWKIWYVTFFEQFPLEVGAEVYARQVNYITYLLSNFNTVLLYPFLITLGTILIVPLTSIGSTMVKEKYLGLQDEAMMWIRKKMPISDDRARRLRSDMIRYKNEKNEIIDSVQNSNDKLQSEITEISGKFDAMNSQIITNESEMHTLKSQNLTLSSRYAESELQNTLIDLTNSRKSIVADEPHSDPAHNAVMHSMNDLDQIKALPSFKDLYSLLQSQPRKLKDLNNINPDHIKLFEKEALIQTKFNFKVLTLKGFRLFLKILKHSK